MRAALALETLEVRDNFIIWRLPSSGVKSIITKCCVFALQPQRGYMEQR